MKHIIGIFLILLCTSSMHAQEAQLLEYQFRVEGLCGMCKDRIEETALQSGAATAEWNEDTKILVVSIDESKLSVSKIRYDIAQAGHDNGQFKAPDEVYENLFLCCLYRDIDKEAHDVMATNNDKEGISEDDLDDYIIGVIYGTDEDGKKVPLIGANVTVLGHEGEGTTTNFEGYFSLKNELNHDAIIVSYIGYNTDTIEIRKNKMLDITMSDGMRMEEIVIKYKRKTSEVSFVKTLNVESITRKELTKAACCNLSESFETNPSVDVSFTDAITGTRQIQMLGLAGPYVQITRELIPDIRVMNSAYGLTYTPGPWIQGIQLIKGAGSVTNGFESIAGQINVELKKSDEGEFLHLNGYANEGSRLEINANTRKEFGENWSTALLVHGKRMGHGNDRNSDGFLDMPLEEDAIIINRWKWYTVKGLVGQFGIKATTQNHDGGSHEHFEGTSTDHENHWRMSMQTRRIEGWAKTGYVFKNDPNASVAIQLKGVYHNQKSEFGFMPYDNVQKSLYANLTYLNILDDCKHTFQLGVNYQLDDVEEIVAKSSLGVFNRYESIPGAYFEYTYNDEEKFAIVPGIRIDHHNNYGVFVTPRLNMKYNFNERSIIRLSAGRGWRTASIFAENLGLFSTNRVIEIEGTNENNPYGLDAEEAWNYGLNFTHGFDIANREFVIAMDVYRTHFENQIIADFEDARFVRFYNLDGQSYSNSFQIKLEYELFKNFDIRTAYRLFDVKMTYKDGTKEKPLLPRHRAFINMAYTTENDWSFDMTWNWRGSQRIPSTDINPEKYRRSDRSPDYVLLNAQVSKSWGVGRFEVYLGGENLLNYRQDDAIIASDDPFGTYFDGSMVYAPLFGKNLYAGFRYNLTK